MELVVRALRCPPPDQPQAIRARFGAGGGRIGRSNTCVLPLPSPDRYISREHLEVRFRDGAFSLKVISKVNGCSVNDSPVPPGAQVQIGDGDTIQLGDYVLVAELEQADAPGLMLDPLGSFGHVNTGRVDSLDRMAELAPRPASGASAQETSTDWARKPSRPPAPAPRPLAQPLEDDPLGSALGKLLESTSAGHAPPSGPAAPARPSHRPLTADDAGSGALDAFLGIQGPLGGPPKGMSDQAQEIYRQDQFEVSMPHGGDRAAAAPDSSEPVEEDIFSSLERDFAGGAGYAQTPPVSRSVPAPVSAASVDDPLAALDDFDAQRTAGRASAPTPVAAPAPPPRPAPAQAAAQPGGVDGAQMLAVLAQALELDPDALDTSRPLETVRIVGELLHLAVGGLYQMLEMRAQLKNELRIEDRTMIASRENNPMKHSDSVQDALRYLVDTRQHGNKLFMQPAKAIGDAVSDVCAHEMAVMAGTRAALLAALKMFSPDVVEKRIEKSGALDSVLPALHRAKLWESFLAMYGELEKEAEDHFDRLLNQEFARAYSEQGKKLRRKK